MNDLPMLVQRTIAGDPDAWRDLQAASQPMVIAIIRRNRAMRAKGLAALPDDVADVAASTFERLARNDFRDLKRFAPTPLSPQPTFDETKAWEHAFENWLFGAADYEIREHLRRRFGRRPKPADPGAPRQPSKRDLQSHAGRLDDHDLDRAFLQTLGMTAHLTAAAIFECVARDFAADDATAIRMYYAEDRSFGEIAAALGMATPDDAKRLIHKLNGRLRYRFVGKKSAGEPSDDASSGV